VNRAERQFLVSYPLISAGTETLEAWRRGGYSLEIRQTSTLRRSPTEGPSRTFQEKSDLFKRLPEGKPDMTKAAWLFFETLRDPL
jgi:hypothetical protein